MFIKIWYIEIVGPGGLVLFHLASICLVLFHLPCWYYFIWLAGIIPPGGLVLFHLVGWYYFTCQVGIISPDELVLFHLEICYLLVIDR